MASDVSLQENPTVRAQPLGHEAGAARPRGDFGDLLRAHREWVGLTQDALAGLSTVSARAIRDLESGRARARARTVQLLADGLRLTGLNRTTFVLAGQGSASEDPASVISATPPAPVSGIIGRETEVRALVHAVEARRRRAASLGGLAGVGKSRIVLEAAQRLHVHRRWPVLWGGRGSQLSPPSPLLQEVEALLEPETVAPHRLCRLIADNDVMIVLDGIDDVAPEAIDALRLLLAACPGLRVITTARGPSGLPDGYHATITPLPTPSPGSDTGPPTVLTRNVSVRFLVERVNETSPEWVLNNDDVPAVATLCRRLDGLPLALELAARQCAVLSIQELAHLPATDLLALKGPDSVAGPEATVGGFIGASCRAVLGTDLERLQTLAAVGRPWSVTEATQILRLDSVEVQRTLHSLFRRGMIRRLDADRPAHFEVLNLVVAYLENDRSLSVGAEPGS